jgi:hypothetical protein
MRQDRTAAVKTFAGLGGRENAQAEVLDNHVNKDLLVFGQEANVQRVPMEPGHV